VWCVVVEEGRGSGCDGGIGEVSILDTFECVVEGGHSQVGGQRGKGEGVGDEVDAHHLTCANSVGVLVCWSGGRKVYASLGRRVYM
jgi:hypothetical protein